MNNDAGENIFKKGEEVDVMPSVKMIEYEKVAYVNEMKEYLRNLKNMKNKDAEKISREQLIKAQIIQENGEFTERYKYSRLNTQNKG